MVLNIICRYALLLKVTLPRNGHQSITTWQDGCSLALGTIRYWVMVHVIGHPAPHLSPCLATCVAQAKVSCKFYFKDFPPRYKVRHNLQHLSWIYHVHSPKYWMDGHIFLAATKQLYEWFSPSVRLSVRPSVCLSVCHTFLTMFPSSYHHEIFRSYYQWQKWRPCKRSRSEVKGQGHRGQHPT